MNKYPIFFRKMVVNCYLNYNGKNKIYYVLNTFKISNGTLFNWLKLYKSNNLKG